jgi:hypothetical protein
MLSRWESDPQQKVRIRVAAQVPEINRLVGLASGPRRERIRLAGCIDRLHGFPDAIALPGATVNFDRPLLWQYQRA